MRWRVGTVGVVAIVVLAAIGGALSCRQIVGVTDSPPTDLTTNACGLPYATTTCASCASASCCNEATACAASSVCRAFEICLGGCSQGDFACRARCQVDHPAGTSSEVSALSACLVSHCENDCGLTCGALAGWAVEPDAAVGFQNCMASTSSSCVRVRACARSSACDAVTRCLAACSTGDCVTTCRVSNGDDPAWCFPDAGESALSSTVAGFTRAASSCATSAGNDWECVGHVSWPALEATTTLLQTRVVDGETGSTTPGMELQACAVGDLDCTMPWGTGYTDEMGWVSLQVSLRPAASTTAYLKLTLAPSTPSASVRLFLYIGSPFTQPRFAPYRCDLNTEAVGFLSPAGTQSVVSTVTAEYDAGADPSRGSVTVVVEDCMHQRAPGVAVTLSTADSQTHMANSMLSPTAAITDSEGQLVFFGVPAGPVTVKAIPSAIGKPSGIVSATVRAAADFPLTSVVVSPTPPE